METFRNYKCKTCGYSSSQEFEKCPKCKNKGKTMTIGFEEKITITDTIKKYINLLWDSNSLTLFGVLITIFLCLLFGFISVFHLEFLCSLLLSFVITFFLIICIKTKKIKNKIIEFMRWILK